MRPGLRSLVVSSLCLFAILSLPACPSSSASQPRSRLVINEVLYDPEGSDTGLEFVEIMNCGREGVALSGWTLETGNGANPDDWTVEWIGSDFDYLEAGGILLIGESAVVPDPDYVTTLDLQNGPDGLRLTDGDSVVDVVGWGEPLFSEYYEGAPAEDVTSGSSLSRSPDCYDHDDNSFDFRISPVPTPGAGNSPEIDLSVEAIHAGRTVFASSETVPLRCVVRNAGSMVVEQGTSWVGVFVDGDSLPASTAPIPVELSPRDTVDVTLECPPVAGYHVALVSVSAPNDGESGNDVAPTSFTVGAPGGLLKLSEIMFSPEEGETEWLEFKNETDGPVDAGGWLLGDDEDMHDVEPAFGLEVPSGGYLVVARDTSALEKAPGCLLATTEGWEALSGDDVVVLLDGFWTPIERVSYDDAWGGDRGVSLERVRVDVSGSEPCNWGSSVAPSGSTPCASNSIHLPASPGSGRLSVSPNPFTPDGDGVDDRTIISYDLPMARATVRVSIYDVRGRKRASLADHEASASRAEIIWDGLDASGSPLPSGLYVVRLEAIDARKGVLVDEKSALGLVR